MTKFCHLPTAPVSACNLNPSIGSHNPDPLVLTNSSTSGYQETGYTQAEIQRELHHRHPLNLSPPEEAVNALMAQIPPLSHMELVRGAAAIPMGEAIAFSHQYPNKYPHYPAARLDLYRLRDLDKKRASIGRQLLKQERDRQLEELLEELRFYYRQHGRPKPMSTDLGGPCGTLRVLTGVI